MLVWYKVDIIIISLKINLFSPWYSWKIAELALNNNHSLCQRPHLDFFVKGVICSQYPKHDVPLLRRCSKMDSSIRKTLCSRISQNENMLYHTLGKHANHYTTDVSRFDSGMDISMDRGRAFKNFQVYQYFTIYKRYFLLNLKNFHEYLIHQFLKSGGTKYHLNWVNLPGTAPYWKVWIDVLVASSNRGGSNDIHAYCFKSKNHTKATSSDM